MSPPELEASAQCALVACRRLSHLKSVPLANRAVHIITPRRRCLAADVDFIVGEARLKPGRRVLREMLLALDVVHRELPGCGRVGGIKQGEKSPVAPLALLPPSTNQLRICSHSLSGLRTCTPARYSVSSWLWRPVKPLTV